MLSYNGNAFRLQNSRPFLRENHRPQCFWGFCACMKTKEMVCIFIRSQNRKGRYQVFQQKLACNDLLIFTGQGNSASVKLVISGTTYVCQYCCLLYWTSQIIFNGPVSCCSLWCRCRDCYAHRKVLSMSRMTLTKCRRYSKNSATRENHKNFISECNMRCLADYKSFPLIDK